MIDAAVIGLGRWGKNIVEAAQGKSKRLRFIRGVSKEPELVRDFAAAKDFKLSTEFEEAVADPQCPGCFPRNPAFPACRADFRRRCGRQTGLV